MKRVPDRHSYKAIARYLNFIELVGANWPNPITVDPNPLSPDTFACRFRDAVAGIMKWNQAPELHEKVSVWYPDFVVAQVQGSPNLVIGPKLTVREKLRPATAVGLVIDASISPLDIVESPSKKVIQAIVTLMDFYVIEHCTLRKANPDDVNEAILSCTRPIEVMENNGVLTLI